jgi:hypothetical protein
MRFISIYAMITYEIIFTLNNEFERKRYRIIIFVSSCTRACINSVCGANGNEDFQVQNKVVRRNWKESISEWR